MKHQVYFIPGYHLLCYCHLETEAGLVLGSLTLYLADAKTNIVRQRIAKADFEKYKPIPIDEARLHSYPFLAERMPNSVLKCWRVTQVPQNKNHLFGIILPGAFELPDCIL